MDDERHMVLFEVGFGCTTGQRKEMVKVPEESGRLQTILNGRGYGWLEGR